MPVSSRAGLCAAALVFCMVATTPAAAQLFRTSPVSVCSNKIKVKTDRCSEVSPPLESLKKTVFPNQRIDFKLIILGDQQAITYLQKNGFLPVKIAVWRDGFRKDTDISIDLSQDDWDSEGDKLVAEFRESGQFTWRTHFYVNINNAQSISIEINDAFGTNVQSAGAPARLAIGFSN